MENKEEIEDLIKLSNSIGNIKAYIQGGGGNTSIKISDNLFKCLVGSLSPLSILEY